MSTTPHPRLAIVGASVRAAAQSAVCAGFDVVGADLFADADLDGIGSITRIENYPEGLADWLATQEIDAWMYTGALENYPELVYRMATTAPLWGVSGAALRRCRDPLHLQQVFHEAGLAFPETRRLAEVDPQESGWLGTTYRHSGGDGVWALNTDADRQRDPNAYAQRFVPGTPIAALYAVADSQSALLGVTEQLMSDDPSDLGYVGSLGPVPCDALSLQRLGNCLHDSIGLRGLIGVDLIVENSRVTVIEINPRFTASVEVLERATGKSAVAALRDACLGEQIGAWPAARDRCIAKWVLFAKCDVTISPAFAEWSLCELRAGRLADRPSVGEVFATSKPVCTVFVEDKNETDARSRLQEAIREAEQRLYEACDPE